MIRIALSWLASKIIFDNQEAPLCEVTYVSLGTDYGKIERSDLPESMLIFILNPA